MQDAGGLGTVTNLAARPGWVQVRWDRTDTSLIYRAGPGEMFDVRFYLYSPVYVYYIFLFFERERVANEHMVLRLVQ